MAETLSQTEADNAKDIGENITQPGTNPGNADPSTIQAPAATPVPTGIPGTPGTPNPAQDPMPGLNKGIPGSIATRFTNRLINHFADRNELTRVGIKEFLTIAEETGLMHRTAYDPVRHAYIKDWADSRAIPIGGEVMAYTDDGEAIMVTLDAPPVPDAGAAAAVGNSVAHPNRNQNQQKQRGRPHGRR